MDDVMSEIPSIAIGGKYLMGYLEFCGYHSFRLRSNSAS